MPGSNLEELSAYHYDLPPELIAQTAIEPRDHSRLMTIDRTSGTIGHRARFTEIAELLRPGDVLVLNNTRVIRARLLGHRLLRGDELGGKIEFFMLERVGLRTWEGLIKSSGRAVEGFTFIAGREGHSVRGTVLKSARQSEFGTVTAQFDRDPLEADAGLLPLPPYVGRPATEADESRYQTVYAERDGSVAAPTAGLHFTPELLAELRTRGVQIEFVTLQVGLGTFRPVKVSRLAEHPMHDEAYEVSSETWDRIEQARRESRRVVAVGTTSVRTLESVAKTGKLSGRTRLFIRPGVHEWKCVDALITNFHLPESTLLMLVSSFAGYELTMRAYDEAVREQYRFFSFGDGMFIT